MRIEKVKCKHYRQLDDIEVVFPKNNDSHDLHIIVGKNGTGKSNFLNAINWCLYAEEPHLSNESNALPLPNQNCLMNSTDGDREVSVEVTISTGEGHIITFLRKSQFDGSSTELEAHIPDDLFNTKIYFNDQAQEFVERFIPKRIREFFFFDGERLDEYFKAVVGQNIKNAIFNISRIDILERIDQERLEKLLKDYTREAGQWSPGIEYANVQVEKCKTDVENLAEEVAKHNEQLKIAKERVGFFEAQLNGVPDISSLEDERRDLMNKKKQKEELLNKKARDKQVLLNDYGRLLLLGAPINYALSLIEAKRKLNELPPRIDKALLEEIISEYYCKVCGRDLDPNSKEFVDRVMNAINLPSDVAHFIINTETSLLSIKDRLAKFKKENDSAAQDISELDRDLGEIAKGIERINNQIAGYDVDLIKEWHRDRKKFEDIRDDCLKKIGACTEKRPTLDQKYTEAVNQLRRELAKSDKVDRIRKAIDFTQAALNILRATKQDILNNTRMQIERGTKELFLDLVWKKQTFSDVHINEDYDISLLDRYGYECIGSTSAAERALLALSFTLALHQISGFDSPIVIDTPVSRVSDANRENFARVFTRVSMAKQTILIFTPSEYSSDISSHLEGVKATKRGFKLSEDESETSVGVL